MPWYGCVWLINSHDSACRRGREWPRTLDVSDGMVLTTSEQIHSHALPLSLLARKVVSGSVRLMFWRSKNGEACRQIQSHAILLSVLAYNPHSLDDPHEPHGAQSPHNSHKPHGAHIPHTPHKPSSPLDLDEGDKVTKSQGVKVTETE